MKIEQVKFKCVSCDETFVLDRLVFGRCPACNGYFVKAIEINHEPVEEKEEID